MSVFIEKQFVVASLVALLLLATAGCGTKSDTPAVGPQPGGAGGAANVAPPAPPVASGTETKSQAADRAVQMGIAKDNERAREDDKTLK